MPEFENTATPSRDHSGLPDRKRRREGDILERAAFFHLVILVIGLSWWFGGQSLGARHAVLLWTTAGIALFLIAWGNPRLLGGHRYTPLRYLWPLFIFDIIVLVSCLNPTTRVIMNQGEQMFLHTDPQWAFLPSTARPDLSWRELWLVNGIIISAFNAFLILHSRRILRHLLTIIAVNALVLAVFGTFQKLSGATGLWFNTVPTPQPYFFSTFVYHNHWGAFTTLNVAACLGLLFNSYRRGGHRDFWHSPVFLGTVAIIFIAATAPLSASRSTTALLALFLFGALVHFLFQLMRRRRDRHESAFLPLAGIGLAATLAVAGIVFLSQDVIRVRAQHTQQQLAHIRTEDALNTRLQLYRDTITMGVAKPAFGWGLESYADVFRIYNTQRARELWFGQRVYREAHNDWLQSFAENGLVGTSLLVLLGVMPLLGVPWRRLRSPLPYYLLAGCALVLLYAWVEFPFANPSVMVSFWLSLFIASRYARLDLLTQQAEKNAQNV